MGRARGFLIQSHVHTGQTERHEVIEGSMRLVIEGRDHLLKQGEAMTVPVGATHRQVPGRATTAPAACACSCAPPATARRSCAA